MLFAVFMGIAVHGSDPCASVSVNDCLTSGCHYNGMFGCSSECKDVGMPAPFDMWTCDMICGLGLAAQMFCADTCGFCPPPPLDWRSDEVCTRQEMQNAVEQEIYMMLASNDYSAVNPCLAMKTHLDQILDGNDQLVGHPNPLLVCGCLEFFDEDFAKEHLNCMLAGYHIADLTTECRDIGTYSNQACDVDAIASELTSAECSGFAAGIADYGSDSFDASTVCGCIDAVDPLVAGKLFNCQMGSSHMMDLYTDVCPAYVKPCDQEEVVNAIITEYAATQDAMMRAKCTAMELHFTKVLDDATAMPLDGKFVDYALVCQCLAMLPERFIDDHLRCGIGGHDAYSLWQQCANHTPKCADLSCSECEERIRCSMSTDGTCKEYCPADGTCLDDPAVDSTCQDLENYGVISTA